MVTMSKSEHARRAAQALWSNPTSRSKLLKKRRTLAWRRQQSEAARRMHTAGAFANSHTEARRASVAEKMRACWRNKEYRARMMDARKRVAGNATYRAKMSARHKANGVRFRPSPGAQRLVGLLGGDWVLEYRVPGWKKHAVDLGSQSLRIAIEVDGYTHLRARQQEWDRLKERRLTALGWQVVRASEAWCLAVSKREACRTVRYARAIGRPVVMLSRGAQKGETR